MKRLATALIIAVLCTTTLTGCDPPAPAWVQLSCAAMVPSKYPTQGACLAAAKRDRVY